MKLCIVNRNTGWPVHDPRHPHGAVIEVDDAEAAKGVASGYLIPADPASPEFLPIHAAILRAHLDAKAKELPPQAIAASGVVILDPEAEAARAAEAAAKAEAERERAVLEILSAPSGDSHHAPIKPELPHDPEVEEKE
jgi:hypothetical protein